MEHLLAYIGPGAGLGFIGSLLAVLAVIAVGFLGLVLYPLKVVLAWIRSRLARQRANETLTRNRSPIGGAS
jgi:hypothetical protein